MKKTAYIVPQMKMFVEAQLEKGLMAGSINTEGGGTDDIEYGGIKDGEGDAKEDNYISVSSVWDD